MMLTLKPFGPVDAALLVRLKEALNTFDEVVIGSEAPVPANAWDRKRGQYRAAVLEASCEAEPGDRVLGVTMADLFEPPLNFVFGHARIQGREAVISLARLQDGGPDRLYERAIKEAMHEIGHTLGLLHDEADPRCVMRFSHDLADTDRKGAEFCPRCRTAAEFTLTRLRK